MSDIYNKNTQSMGKKIYITESQLDFVINNVDLLNEQEQVKGVDVIQLVKTLIEKSKANNGGDWSDMGKVSGLQDKIANAIVQKLRVTNKNINKLHIDALENEMTGKQQVISNKEGKLFIDYGSVGRKVWEKDTLSITIIDDYINASIKGVNSFMVAPQKSKEGGTLHTKMYPGTQKFPKGKYGIDFFYMFGETKPSVTPRKEVEPGGGDGDGGVTNLNINLDNPFPFNRVSPRQPSGEMIGSFTTAFNDIRTYLNSIKKGGTVNLTMQSSASHVPPSNILPQGYTKGDHTYNGAISKTDWVTAGSEGGRNIDDGNTYLASQRGRSTIASLNTFLGGTLKVSNNTYSIMTPDKKKIVITLQHGVNGDEWVKGADKESYKKDQYLRIQSTEKTGEETGDTTAPKVKETETSYYVAPASHLRVTARLL